MTLWIGSSVDEMIWIISSSSFFNSFYIIIHTTVWMVSVRNWCTAVTYNLIQNTKVIFLLWYVSALIAKPPGKLQWSKNVGKICQSWPRQSGPVQGASINPHTTLSSLQSPKFGKHSTCVIWRPCAWLHKKEFYCQANTTLCGFQLPEKERGNLALDLSLEILKR